MRFCHQKQPVLEAPYDSFPVISWLADRKYSQSKQVRELSNTGLMNQEYPSPTPLFHLPSDGEGQGNLASLASANLRRLVRALNRTLRDYEGNSSLIERFDELTKVIYCKVYDERDKGPTLHDAAFRIQAGDADETVATRIREQFLDLVTRRPDLFPERFSRLQLGDSTVRKLVEELCRYRLASVSEDLKGLLYEEIIRNTFDKGENQQFFTPRAIVEFMVEALDSSLDGRICDPACGTGGFLLHVDKHLKRNRSASDATLLGFEIDERLSWVAGVNLDMHDPACTVSVSHINSSGSLGPALKPYFGTIDAIVTNPPFGSDLSEKDSLGDFRLGKDKASRRRGVLFIERCLELLKPGGVGAVIIDDSVLNGPSNVDTRRLILDQSHPLAIISLPDTAFMPYASVKSSILFLQKICENRTAQPENHLTFFAHAEVVGRKPNGDPLLKHEPRSGKMELDSDLPEILRAWRAGSEREAPRPAWSSGNCFWARIPPVEAPAFFRDAFRIDPAYHHPARSRVNRALRSSRHPLKPLRELCGLRNEGVLPAKDLCEDEITYLGLANIESHTGVYRPVLVDGSSLKSSVKRFVAGDILFAKMRPALRKVCLIGDDFDEGFASSECLVLTPKCDPASGAPIMLPDLLSILLRSDLAYGQLIHLVTGIGRPRLSKAAVLDVRIPVPELAEQRRLLGAYSQSDSAARSLVEESGRALEMADRIMSQARRDMIDDILSSSRG